MIIFVTFVFLVAVFGILRAALLLLLHSYPRTEKKQAADDATDLLLCVSCAFAAACVLGANCA